MVDLKQQVLENETADADVDTLAAIDRGLADVEAGRTVSLAAAAEMIPHWISKFASQKPR
jgi:predicted transcriptional regulator